MGYLGKVTVEDLLSAAQMADSEYDHTICLLAIKLGTLPEDIANAPYPHTAPLFSELTELQTVPTRGAGYKFTDDGEALKIPDSDITVRALTTKEVMDCLKAPTEVHTTYRMVMCATGRMPPEVNKWDLALYAQVTDVMESMMEPVEDEDNPLLFRLTRRMR